MLVFIKLWIVGFSGSAAIGFQLCLITLTTLITALRSSFGKGDDQSKVGVLSCVRWVLSVGYSVDLYVKMQVLCFPFRLKSYLLVCSSCQSRLCGITIAAVSSYKVCRAA